MSAHKIIRFVAATAIVSASFTGIAAAQGQVGCTESPNLCEKVIDSGEKVLDDTTQVEEQDPSEKVLGQVVTRTPAATQQDGLGGSQGALALTGGDAIGLSVIGAGLLGAGALVVLGSRRKGEADS